MTCLLSPLDILREIGERFKEYRLRYGLTQKKLSDLTCVSVTTISKLENGNLYDISFSTLFKLLHMVNLDENWEELVPLLPESPYMYKRQKKVQRIRSKKKS